MIQAAGYHFSKAGDDFAEMSVTKILGFVQSVGLVDTLARACKKIENHLLSRTAAMPALSYSNAKIDNTYTSDLSSQDYSLQEAESFLRS
jgi:hypothetical protein